VNGLVRLLAGVSPEWAKRPLRAGRRLLQSLPYRGTERVCPICNGESSRFAPFGTPTRDEGRCIHCDSLERHRFLWLYLTMCTDLFDGRHKRMLHVAPEPCFVPRFEARLGRDYLTADLANPRAMLRMDIEDIQFPDAAFDVIYCSHVLEHVRDDRRAMREFRRVLKPDGWAILLVPIMSDATFEDESIVDPAERLKAFGDETHVRRYGPDYADRLRESGFEARITAVPDMFGPEERLRMGLSPASGEIFHCTGQPV